MTELIWDGKYKDGKKQGPVRIALPFQTIETVNESAQDRQRALELFSAGRHTEWRNRLIWGDKKYVLPSLLPEFAGKVNLIYIDPPFDTGADFFLHGNDPRSARCGSWGRSAGLHPGRDQCRPKGRRYGRNNVHQGTFYPGAESLPRHVGTRAGFVFAMVLRNGGVAARDARG
jgi:hypothetical protein